MKRIRAFVVDDEPPARKRLVELLEREPDIEVAGVFARPGEALEAMERASPDLLFLDVQMPELDGFAVLERSKADPPPVTVFVTAYDAYALKAFEVQALDYLLKPFSDERFEAALARARQRLASREREALGERLLSLVEGDRAARSERFLERVVIRKPGRILFLDVAAIEWIEAAGVYVTVHEGGREHLLRESLGALETKLDPSRFARIHRSTLVALDRVKELRIDDAGGHRVVLRDGSTLRLSRRHREGLEDRLSEAR
ncbi:MAG TPA: LytTR family DNA-binding domain-containing protein [Vicinamibacteria bacterium]|nr:LytTR family DNA-binding domain-containing protein [Vicinamibacteria bacterium]